jgi:sulfur carrier protein
MGLAVTINGESQLVTARNVTELLAELALDARKVAVERNLSIVPRSQHGQTALSDGDRIEIVQFIGGG